MKSEAKSFSFTKGETYATHQDSLVRRGKVTRFRIKMEFEVEVRGSQVEPVSVMRDSARVSREIRGRLIKTLRKTTGRKSLGISESSCGPEKSAYAFEDENPFLPPEP